MLLTVMLINNDNLNGDLERLDEGLDESVVSDADDSQVLQNDGEQEDGADKLVLVVGHGIRHSRLDKYLHSRFGQFSRTTIQKLIKEQGVSVNGKPAKASASLRHKDVLELILPPKPSREIIPEDIPLDVLYEDGDIIVINKQAGIISHPARGNTCGTLVNALVHYSNQLSSGGQGDDETFRPGIVHRLDRNTTGVMVVAKNDTAHWRISRQFQNRTTQKYYLAITHGAPQLDGDCISQPLGVHPRVREKYAIRPDIGKEAITFYKVLERFRGYALVQAMPKTGRTHQIRIHLAHIKNAIVADDMYGGKALFKWQIEDKEPQVEDPVMARCALHAWKLEINHPVSNERMFFEAPLPADMQNTLDLLRKYRPLVKSKI